MHFEILGVDTLGNVANLMQHFNIIFLFLQVSLPFDSLELGFYLIWTTASYLNEGLCK